MTKRILYTSMVAMTVVLGGCSVAKNEAPLPTTAGEGREIAQQHIRTVDVEAFAEVIAAPDIVVLDVRTPAEYAQGRITADAKNINFYDDDFRAQISALPRDASYALYCRSGSRSGKTRALMKELGFRNVTELRGGINAWKQAGKPTVQ